jgi:nitrate reductase NapAB chaperone NapD
MLYVDVNLGDSGTQRIVVYEGDTAEGLAEKFSVQYNLDSVMKEKLIQMLH